MEPRVQLGFGFEAPSTNRPLCRTPPPNYTPVSCVAGRAKRGGATRMTLVFVASQSRQARYGELVSLSRVRERLMWLGAAGLRPGTVLPLPLVGEGWGEGAASRMPPAMRCKRRALPTPAVPLWSLCLCVLCVEASSHAPVLFNTEDTEAQRTQSQCSRRRGKLLMPSAHLSPCSIFRFPGRAG